MKILYPNLLEIMEPYPEQAAGGFAISNLYDEHQQRIWKSASIDQVQTILFRVAEPSVSLALFGLDASSVRLQIYDDASMTSLVLDKSESTSRTDSYGQSDLTALWFDYPSLPMVFGRLQLTPKTGSVARLGIASAGPVIELPNPVAGLSEEVEDLSIIQPLQSGGEMVIPRPVCRTPRGSIEIPGNAEGRRLFYDSLRFKRRIGSTPFACLYLSGMRDHEGNSMDHEYAIWARFASLSGVEGAYSHSTIHFTLKEFL